MIFKLHNKICVQSNGKSYTFFNQMFRNTYNQISKFEPYFSHLAVGTGFKNSFESYTLASHKKTIPLETESLQDDISKGKLCSRKVCIVDSLDLDGMFLTEIGICTSTISDPEIFNYFSLISEELPQGIMKEKGKPIIFTVYVYLSLENTENLTLGHNPLIDLILGEGIENKNIYAMRGCNLSSKPNLDRAVPVLGEKFPAKISFEISNSLNINFEFDLKSGEINEIVLLINDVPFFRTCVQNHKNKISTTLNIAPKEHYIVDVGKNIASVVSVTNTETATTETQYHSKAYATEFGDKIQLPFHNMFNAETPRFLSKDGKRIYFLIDDYIYAYENSNFEINEIATYDLHIQNIQKIVAFDDLIFLLVKEEPYIQAYRLTNQNIEQLSFNINNYTLKNNLAAVADFDATISYDNTFMFGFIFAENKSASAVYFSFNEEQKQFNFEHENNFSSYELHNVVAMLRNNFSDALLIFLKSGEYSYDCKIINNYPNKTYTDVNSVLSYYYTKDTKSIYAKGRAIVIEKQTSPALWLYFYPQIYRYNLPLLSDEVDNYLSTNLLYLIQKHKNNNYRIYSLVGYKSPEEFSNGFPSTLDKSKILDFEFLEDTLLVFLNDKKEKIVAFNLKTTNLLIENVSSTTATYEIVAEKYNLLGENNEGVIVQFALNITI